MKNRFKRFRITKVGLFQYRKTKKIKNLRCGGCPNKKRKFGVAPIWIPVTLNIGENPDDGKSPMTESFLQVYQLSKSSFVSCPEYTRPAVFGTLVSRPAGDWGLTKTNSNRL